MRNQEQIEVLLVQVLGWAQSSLYKYYCVLTAMTDGGSWSLFK